MVPIDNQPGWYKTQTGQPIVSFARKIENDPFLGTVDAQKAADHYAETVRSFQYNNNETLNAPLLHSFDVTSVFVCTAINLQKGIIVYNRHKETNTSYKTFLVGEWSELKDELDQILLNFHLQYQMAFSVKTNSRIRLTDLVSDLTNLDFLSKPAEKQYKELKYQTANLLSVEQLKLKVKKHVSCDFKLWETHPIPFVEVLAEYVTCDLGPQLTEEQQVDLCKTMMHSIETKMRQLDEEEAKKSEPETMESNFETLQTSEEPSIQKEVQEFGGTLEEFQKRQKAWYEKRRLPFIQAWKIYRQKYVSLFEAYTERNEAEQYKKAGPTASACQQQTVAYHFHVEFRPAD